MWSVGENRDLYWSCEWLVLARYQIYHRAVPNILSDLERRRTGEGEQRVAIGRRGKASSSASDVDLVGCGRRFT